MSIPLKGEVVYLYILQYYNYFIIQECVIIFEIKITTDELHIFSS